MSHSTHTGFNCPLTTDLGVEESPVRQASVRLTPAWALLPALFRLPPPDASLVVGVGQRFTAPVSSNSSFRSPPRLVCPPVAHATVGVGQRFTATFSGSELRSHWLGPALFLASWAVGVGQDGEEKDPVPEVRRTNGGCG